MSKEDAVEGTAVPSPDMQRALYAALKEGFDAAAHALGIEPLDVRYPSSAPKAEELAFTAPAWNYDAPIDVSVEDARDKGRSAIAQISSQLANPTLSPEQRLKVSERLGNLDDAIKSGDAVAINAAIMQAQAELSESLAQAKNDEASVQLETPDQKVARLEAELKAMDENIAKDLEELRRRGLIDDEEYNRLKAERARLDAMDINDPERIKGEKAYNRALGDVADEAEDKARERGDDEGTKAAGRVKRDAKKRDDVTDEIEAAHAGKAQAAAAEQPQPAYATHPSAAPSVYEPTHVEDRSSGQLPTPPAVIAQNDKDQKVGGGVSF